MGCIATSSNPRIFLSAGEASGDHYGSALISALRERLPNASFTGLGGVAMQTAGQVRVVRAEDVAHMGITEVIRHMPRIYGEYRRLVRSIEAQPPAIAILIDFPDVNFRLARKLEQLNIPVVWFVSPQLWAWKRGRLKWVQERVARMLVIFPFEQEFYRARGVNAEFVGHPLAEMPMPASTREEYAARYGLDLEKPWIGLLPGSRMKEVLANLGVMIDLVQRFPVECEYLVPVASTIGRNPMAVLVDHAESVWPVRIQKSKLATIHLVDEAREALFHARASVVASGTATVQAAVIGNPFVVVYQVSKLTFKLAKRLVSYPKEIPAQVDEAGNLPIGMVNLIAGRRVVPEFLQERFTSANIGNALQPLLEDGPERSRMIADLAEVRVRLVLGEPGRGTAIERVRDAVMDLLGVD